MPPPTRVVGREAGVAAAVERGGPQREEQEERDILKRHLDTLPDRQREAIVLCFEGFSYGEVGEILGISTNAAMLRCQRAKTALRAIMERKS